MKKLIALLGSVTALAMSMPANAAIISIVSFPPGAVFFPFLSNSAIFGASPTGAFDDTFTFTVPQTGTASLSVSTSSSTMGGVVTFSKILFNTTNYYPAAFSATGVSGIPITASAIDTIELVGTTVGTSGVFSGTVTFTPGATVPEPATWATFLLGFGFLGLGLRRRSAKNLVAA